MKNKAFLLVLIISFSFLFSVFYVNYYTKNIYANNFKEIEEIEVYSKYKTRKINLCYGTKYNCKSIKYKTKGKVNTKKIGIYTITYKTNYKDLSFSKDMKVKVKDTKKPVIKIDGNFSEVCKNGKTETATITANDNYDGDITKNISYKVENGKITYKVSDSSGNKREKSFDITIKDTKKPNLVLNGDNTIYLSVGSKYEEPGFAALDNCDGDITKNVITLGSVNTKKAGTYEIAYKVKDDFNNEMTLKRIVKVFDKNNYSPDSVSSKVIYLTFDDGPGPYTATLLDILKKYDVKTTFFVTGYNNNYNDLLKRQVDDGHTVGLHSYTHNYSLIYTSIDAYMDDLLKIQNKVKEYTGIESKIIRFPGGSSNTISRRYRVGIMSDLTKKVEEIGFRYFDWTILSGDAGNTKDPNKIIENVISGVKENQVNVVLMHDIKPYTVDSIERIIEFGLSNGYTFAPLTINSPVVHDTVNN